MSKQFSTAGRVHTTTSFAGQGGRKAGCGMCYDDYSESSGNPLSHSYSRLAYLNRVRFPNDDTKPDDLNGECIIIQAGKKKEEE